MTYMPNNICSSQTTFKKAKFLEFGLKNANLPTLQCTVRYQATAVRRVKVKPLILIIKPGMGRLQHKCNRLRLRLQWRLHLSWNILRKKTKPL